jgi:hypothetical protein
MSRAAASPHSQVAVWPNRPIVIWYGEELTPSWKAELLAFFAGIR